MKNALISSELSFINLVNFTTIDNLSALILGTTMYVPRKWAGS